MTDPASRSAEASAPLPDLILYSRDGCHLCDEARDLIAVLLADRADAGLSVPAVIERDIETNADWEREFLTTIPVVELGARRLAPPTSAPPIRRLLDETLAGAPAAS